MGSPTVVVADDDATGRARVGDELRGEGFAVEQLTGGQTVLDRAARRRYELVVLDIAVQGLRRGRGLPVDPRRETSPS